MTTLDPVPVDAGTGRSARCPQMVEQLLYVPRTPASIQRDPNREDQVHSVGQALDAAEAGADVLIAQGDGNAFVDEWYARDDDVRRMRGELAERTGKASRRTGSTNRW